MGSNSETEKIDCHCSSCCNNGKLGPFPPGFRFNPSDEQLIVYYLQPKVNNMKLPPNMMHVIDLYDPVRGEEFSPQQLTETYEAQGEREWYFFTSRDRKYPNGSRPNRASAGGFWKASAKDTDIISNGTLVGMKKTLVFHVGKPPLGKKTNWIMHEFRLPNYLHDSPPPTKRARISDERIKLDDWVLCRIRYNGKGDKKGWQSPPKQSSANSTPEVDVIKVPIDDKVMDFTCNPTQNNPPFNVVEIDTALIPGVVYGNPTNDPRSNTLKIDVALAPDGLNGNPINHPRSNTLTTLIPSGIYGNLTNHPRSDTLNTDSAMMQGGIYGKPTNHLRSDTQNTDSALMQGGIYGNPTNHPRSDTLNTDSALMQGGIYGNLTNISSSNTLKRNVALSQGGVNGNPTNNPRSNPVETETTLTSGGIYGNQPTHDDQVVFENTPGYETRMNSFPVSSILSSIDFSDQQHNNGSFDLGDPCPFSFDFGDQPNYNFGFGSSNSDDAGYFDLKLPPIADFTEMFDI